MKENAAPSTLPDAMVPRFWRDDTLPFVEARAVHDGRNVCYAKHTHDVFSIGVVTEGRCTYINERLRERIGVGSVVVINPGDVHACNPLDREAWSYRMLYVDVPWLAELQRQLGVTRDAQFRVFSTALSTRRELYGGFNLLHALLTSHTVDPLRKHCALLTFFGEVQRWLNPAPQPCSEHNHKLARAAEYIRENCTHALKLDEICAAAELSASYLIRAFKRCYGMTPHTYLIDRRVDYCRVQLRRGRTIAEVAIEAGFSDQAHLQRVFRQFMAATPGQYRRRA
ncbi:AraC family transcriptional regulator [Paraburkholderia solisilvae]|uniref:HTH-type transcriptional activator RhaR n=1 Tax=Paraburkholderia solisilvae TaxID=624376 RepID=A0A6J5E9F1_9BURK|nr:AraC family transcriptional regulator [Paraburkholderia solisilvae]CAB3763150.1 HTH-type transcriptional activator RhaR [Paraburkholderia solisilvae]